jgi:amino acid permease
MEKGRARSSTVSLISCALGTGILALPHAFCQCGILVASLIVILAAILNNYVCQLLARSCDLTNSVSYEDIGVSLYGAGSKRAMDYIQAFVLFGITTALLIVSGDNLSGVLQSADTLSSSDSAVSISEYCTVAGTEMDVPSKCRLVATTLPTVLIILPLSLLKDMSSLRYTSTFCVACVFFVMFALMVKVLLIDCT